MGRTAGIGAGIVGQPAASGRGIACTYGPAYDERMTWGIEPGAADAIGGSAARHGAATTAIEAGLSDQDAPAAIFDAGGSRLGGVTALDRITPAVAQELSHFGATANVSNPGSVDTGWMSDDVRVHRVGRTPLGRLGTPQGTRTSSTSCARPGGSGSTVSC